MCIRDSGYGTSNDPIATLAEFKDMVKALHKAGIEIILDVVFNHTAEGLSLIHISEPTRPY